MNVELPDGTIAEFPDDMPQQQIESVIQQQFGQAGQSSPTEERPAFAQMSPGDMLKLYLSDPIEEAQKLGKTAEIAGSFVVPGMPLGQLGKALSAVPGIGKYLAPALSETLSQALYSGATTPENRGQATMETASMAAPFSLLGQAASQGSPVTRFLSKGLMGLGLGLGSHKAMKEVGVPEIASIPASVLLGSLAARGRAKDRLLRPLKETDYRKTLDASKRLGLSYITPAEASQLPSVSKVEGGIGRTEVGGDLLQKRALERSAAEQKSIENLARNIYDPDQMNEFKEFFYKSSYKDKVAQGKLKNLRKDPVFKNAEKLVQKDPAFQKALEGVETNSVEYLDQVKRKLDDQIKKSINKGENNKARILKDTRKELLQKADSSSKDYALARELAEREKARNKIEDYFDKRKMSGAEFSKYLASNKNYKELHNHLRNAPQAQSQLEDMKIVFEKLFAAPTAKASRALSSGSISAARSSGQFLEQKVDDIIGFFDRGAVDLMTNPRWEEELNKLSKLTRGEKFISNAAKLATKLSSVLPKSWIEKGPMSEEVRPRR